MFLNIATLFGGRAIGGPAKVAVIGSSLFGMVSGSASANGAVIGAMTIPMMKKVVMTRSLRPQLRLSLVLEGKLCLLSWEQGPLLSQRNWV